jgi:hypothetical protein
LPFRKQRQPLEQVRRIAAGRNGPHQRLATGGQPKYELGSAIVEEFGIIVACCDQDYLFAKGCCASIRHFLGDVPICLLIDGTFSVSEMENTYGVRTIKHWDVSHKVLRERSLGWGLTKMIAFWESPWENFLFLDADTLVWGDVLKYANLKDFDLIIDRPCQNYSDRAISYFFFDIPGMEKHFPDFDWQKHRSDYYCTGTFFAKRDVFSLSEYVELLNFIEKHPGIFKHGEMGLLNFMIFRAAERGKIRLAQEPMQLLVRNFDQREVEKRFPILEAGPGRPGEEAAVIHWAGPVKPTRSRCKLYSEPMSFFRRKFLRDAWGITGSGAEVALEIEDVLHWLHLYKNKARRLVAKKLKFHL